MYTNKEGGSGLSGRVSQKIEIQNLVGRGGFGSGPMSYTFGKKLEGNLVNIVISKIHNGGMGWWAVLVGL